MPARSLPNGAHVQPRAERPSIPRLMVLGMVLGTVLIGLTSASVRAQNGLSPPVARERAQPEQPTNQFGMPLEGWVKVRYSVLADGTTADVRVIDTMPPQLSSEGAVSAVEAWTFEPATDGGEPIDWYNNETTVVFDDEAVPLEPSPIFAQAYVDVIELLGEEDFDEAKSRNERLIETASRLSEIGLAQVQSAIVNITLSDLHTAYDAVLRATDPDVVTLDPEELREALRYRFALALELGHVVDALEAFLRLDELEAVPEDDQTALQAAAIDDALKTDATIIAKARVGRDPWGYVPTRRTFTIADVDGAVRAIQVECDRTKTQLEYVADVDWTLPESWGDCALFVDARRNTVFSVYEFK